MNLEYINDHMEGEEKKENKSVEANNEPRQAADYVQPKFEQPNSQKHQKALTGQFSMANCTAVLIRSRSEYGH